MSTECLVGIAFRDTSNFDLEEVVSRYFDLDIVNIVKSQLIENLGEHPMIGFFFLFIDDVLRDIYSNYNYYLSLTSGRMLILNSKKKMLILYCPSLAFLWRWKYHQKTSWEPFWISSWNCYTVNSEINVIFEEWTKMQD